MQPSLFRKGHSLMGKQPQKIDNMAFNIDFNEQDRCVVLTVKVHVCNDDHGCNRKNYSHVIETSSERPILIVFKPLSTPFLQFK